ncbi:MAG: AI-2E family transporter [Solirubrobacterales bacterium]
MAPATRVALNLILIAAAIAIVFWALWQLRVVVVPVVVALLLATLLMPPVDLLRRHGWPSAIATLFAMAVSVAVLAGAVVLIAPAFVDQFGDLENSVDEAIEEVVRWLVAGPFDLERSEIDQAVEIALISEGPLAAALVVGAITAIQQLEGDFLYPNVVGRMIRLHPVAILLTLAAGTVLAGIVGALLSVPVAAAIWTAIEYVRRDRSVLTE